MGSMKLSQLLWDGITIIMGWDSALTHSETTRNIVPCVVFDYAHTELDLCSFSEITSGEIFSSLLIIPHIWLKMKQNHTTVNV